MSSDTKTIYIQLFDDGTLCWRPTQGVSLGDDRFRVLATPDYDVADEKWEFLPESIVECILRMHEGQQHLFAISLVQPPPRRKKG